MSGQVPNLQNQLISGVTIVVKGSTTGVLADFAYKDKSRPEP